MTKKERASPKIIDGKRRRRIAAGSGTKVEEVNKLLKMHRQMADMMKKMGKNKGMMSRMMGGLGMGGMPEPTPEMIEQAEALQKSGELPKGQPGLPAGALPKGLPGLGGGGLPGLGGPALPPGALPGLGGASVGPARKKKRKK